MTRASGPAALLALTIAAAALGAPEPPEHSPAAATQSDVTAPPATWRAPSVPRRESGNLVFDNIPPVDAGLAARLARYLGSRQAGLIDFLADGSLLITTRFGDTEQLHRVAAPLHAREQLTF